MNRYSDFTDEDLAQKAQAGNRDAEAALTTRYWDLTGILANSFPIPGVDLDDRQAEALQGLLKAIRGWTPGKGTKFKTFAKMAIRRVLTDLYREVNQKSEIPASIMRSLDDAVSADGDDLSLIEVIAGDEDPASDVIARQDAIDRRAEVAEAQWNAFAQTVSGTAAEASERLVASVKTFARDLVAQGNLSLDIYRDLIQLVDQRGQLGLFGIMSEGIESSDLARRVFEEYANLQWLILCDVAEGYEHAEIAQRRGIRVEVVAQMLAAIRERVGVMEDPEPIAMAA